MAPLIPILIGIAADVGAPLVKSILEKKVGYGTGVIAETVIKTVAEHAGATPESLSTVDSAVLAEAVSATEAEAPEIIAAWVEQQRLMNENIKAEHDKGGPTWTWAWRPAWMWLLAFIWTYALILRPVVNAAFGASIESVDLAVLMTLTGAYLALYMGGHTAQNIFGRRK